MLFLSCDHVGSAADRPLFLSPLNRRGRFPLPFFKRTPRRAFLLFVASIRPALFPRFQFLYEKSGRISSFLALRDRRVLFLSLLGNSYLACHPLPFQLIVSSPSVFPFSCACICREPDTVTSLSHPSASEFPFCVIDQ